MAPQNANPPALPPTVEEAYRRKCIQLKQRSKEIDEENDGYKLRLDRLKRQIQKSRLERAFLLEQIAKRTSTNVEDSEGSPSPPPTPQDKPLRTKRGHRKPSLLPNDGAGGSNAGMGNQPVSPSSDAFSQPLGESQSKERGRGANGVNKLPKRPSNAFEIYCNVNRPLLVAENKEKIESKEFRVEEEMARRWKDLPDSEKEMYVEQYEQELEKWKEERDARKKSLGGRVGGSRTRDSGAGGSRRGGSRPRKPRFEKAAAEDDDDQDVEMAEAEDLSEERPAEAEADQDETEVEDNEVAGED